MQKLRLILYPFSLIYALIVRMRNWAYDRNWLKSRKGDLPTVVIGNINFGGTGKSPHTLWLADALQELKPAILSRGYGRKSFGFNFVTSDDHARECGDEPLMYKRTRPHLVVAVSEDRLEGIRRIASESDAKIVILDDAFQHRKLEGDFNLVMFHSEHLPHRDYYFPAGNLRDHRCRLNQADAIVITHLPVNSNDHPPVRAIQEELRKKLPIKVNTPIFFSKTKYGTLIKKHGATDTFPNRIVVVTGIAKPEGLVAELGKKHEVVRHFNYRDHRTFDDDDVHTWKHFIETGKADAVVTTSKDYARMNEIAEVHDLPIFVQPIEVQIADGEELLARIKTAIAR